MFDSHPHSATSDCILCQLFRFVERPAVRGFISYLNPKVEDGAIPKKTCMVDTVNTKVEKLDNIYYDWVNKSMYFLHSFVHIYSGNKLEDKSSFG